MEKSKIIDEDDAFVRLDNDDNFAEGGSSTDRKLGAE